MLLHLLPILAISSLSLLHSSFRVECLLPVLVRLGLLLPLALKLLDALLQDSDSGLELHWTDIVLAIAFASYSAHLFDEFDVIGQNEDK